jgi:16S rRNA (guanine(966)-N(2))-methyltransferase RsmD
MRIISGSLKGRRIQAPKNLPVRPTTDNAKEALFNILENEYDFQELRVLDLFSGIGSISLEFLSRGVKEVISVDQNYGCVRFQKQLQGEFELENYKVFKNKAEKAIEKVEGKFDLIFADPPYAMKGIPELAKKILSLDLLTDGGVFILEHGKEVETENLPVTETRKYGRVIFSFFRN